VVINRVLVVDDTPELRRLLRRAFRDCDDFEVVDEAADGAQALERVRDLQPEVILLDINMPRRNGLDVLGEIRDADPNAVIVVFSGMPDSIGEQALSKGADAFVAKGTSLKDLIADLRGMIAERTP
jgi:CheY-like chemotaxis protein